MQIDFSASSYTVDGLLDSFITDINGYSSILGMGWVTMLFLLAFSAGTYILYSYTILYNGRKAKLRNDWMAFVPFARTIYRLETVGDPWWKMFILGEWYVYLYLINVLIPLVIRNINLNAMFIINVVYIVGVLTMHVFHRSKYFKTFGLSPVLGLLPLTFFPCFLIPIDCVIAFSDKYPHVGTGEDVRADPSLASITGLTGMYAGQDFPIAEQEETVLGRDSAFSNIIIDQHADKVSRKHCSVKFDPSAGNYVVIDYSTNGTFIDGGSRLTKGMPIPLTRGTVIALGNRENRFKLN